MKKIISSLKNKNRQDLINKVEKVMADDFSILKLKPGDYVVQENKNLKTYAYLISELKNKGFKAVVIDTERKKAKQGTVSNRWYPLPKKIKESDIPDKLLSKIKSKLP